MMNLLILNQSRDHLLHSLLPRSSQVLLFSVISGRIYAKKFVWKLQNTSFYFNYLEGNKFHCMDMAKLIEEKVRIKLTDYKSY